MTAGKVLKVPMRRCVGCGQSKDKKQLLRIVRTPQGEILPDRTGRANGRGAYLCNDPGCLALARRKKAFNRAFGAAVDPAVYDELEKELGGGQTDAG